MEDRRGSCGAPSWTARQLVVDPDERATSCWFRVAGPLRRRDLAVEIVEAKIRSAQQQVILVSKR